MQSTLTVRISEAEAQTLDSLCSTTGKSRSEVVRDALRGYSLRESLRQSQAQLAPLARLCLSATALATATPAQLNQVSEKLAGQMKNRRERPNNFLTLDLRDLIELRGYIILTRRNEKVFVEEYRRRVDDRRLMRGRVEVLNDLIGYFRRVMVDPR